MPPVSSCRALATTQQRWPTCAPSGADREPRKPGALDRKQRPFDRAPARQPWGKHRITAQSESSKTSISLLCQHLVGESDLASKGRQGMANFCSECGAALTGSKRFCPECGAPMGLKAESRPVTAAPLADVAEPEVLSDGSAPAEMTVGTVSVELLRAFADLPEEEARRFVAGHKSTPGDVLRTLARDPSISVRRTVAFNVSTPGAVLSSLATDSCRASVAANTSAPVNVLRALATDSDEGVRYEVASNPCTPEDALATLASDTDEIVRDEAVRNPSATERLLRTLAADPAEDVRQGPASHRATPEDLLRLLAEDPTSSVRMEVAGNPSTPVDVLGILASDSSIGVRMEVAGNSSTPVDVLGILASDFSADVRYAVAGNTRTSREVLRSLAGDMKSYIRGGAAGNPVLAAELLLILGSDTDESVRARTAGNLSTPLKVLRTLAADSSESVRVGVAGNASVSPDVLEALSSDPLAEVREGVASNPLTDPEVLRVLATDPTPDSHSDYYVRTAVAGHPSTPVDVLSILAVDPDETVRDAAAGNPSTPLRALPFTSGSGGTRTSPLGDSSLDEPTTAENTEAASNGVESNSESGRVGVHLTFESETSSKFWEARVDGTTTVVHFGKLGSRGQTRTHEYPTASEAEAAVARKIAEKLRKGYVLEESTGGSPGCEEGSTLTSEKESLSVLEDPRIASGLWFARGMVQAGYFTPREIVDFCWVNDDEFDGNLAQCWQAVEELWIDAERKWDPNRTSDADRLDLMLKILRARNLIVAENEEDCRTCIGAWATNAMRESAEAGPAPIGWVGFHSQDIESGVGPDLLFYYGAYFPAEVDDQVAATADTDVARLVQDAAQIVGLDTEWQGDTSQRLTVLVPDWRKRHNPFDRWAESIRIEYPANLVKVLDMLGQDADPRVRAAAASSPNAPAALLHQLASDISPIVRCQVADNPSTYLALLRWLADSDPDAEVRGLARAKLA